MKKTTHIWFFLAVLSGGFTWLIIPERMITGFYFAIIFLSLGFIPQGVFELKMEYGTQDPWYHEATLKAVLLFIAYKNRNITTYRELGTLVLVFWVLWVTYKKLFGIRIEYRRKRRAETHSSRELKLPRKDQMHNDHSASLCEPDSHHPDLERLMHQFVLEYQDLSSSSLIHIGRLYAYHEAKGLDEFPLHQLVVTIALAHKKTKDLESFNRAIEWHDILRFLKRNSNKDVYREFQKTYHSHQNDFEYRQAFIMCDVSSFSLLNEILTNNHDGKRYLTQHSLTNQILVSTFVAYAINAIFIMDRMGKHIYSTSDLGVFLLENYKTEKPLDTICAQRKRELLELFCDALPGVTEHYLGIVLESFFEKQKPLTWDYQITADLDLFANMTKQVTDKVLEDSKQASTIAFEWAMMMKHSSKLTSVSLWDLLRFSTTLSSFETLYFKEWQENALNP